jgi:hypothetical protein
VQFTGVEAAALNVAVAGSVTVSASGCSVIDGAAAHAAALTVSVAGLLVVALKEFLKTASYLVPLWAVVVAGVV